MRLIIYRSPSRPAHFSAYVTLSLNPSPRERDFNSKIQRRIYIPQKPDRHKTAVMRGGATMLLEYHLLCCRIFSFPDASG